MNAGRPFCTAIVCAYNEERTLTGVLDTLTGMHLIDEIIVVNDGSIDGTADILEQVSHHSKVKAVHFEKNRGKGCAMATAARQAQGEILVFLDADLLNLNAEHVTRLVTKLFPLHAIAGQRAVFRADFLPLAPAIETSGYGVETLLNLSYRHAGKPVSYLYLDDLLHPIKLEKTNTISALQEYALEAGQIIETTIRHYPLFLAAFGLHMNPRQRQSA